MIKFNHERVVAKPDCGWGKSLAAPKGDGCSELIIIDSSCNDCVIGCKLAVGPIQHIHWQEKRVTHSMSVSDGSIGTSTLSSGELGDIDDAALGNRLPDLVVPLGIKIAA